VARVFYNANCQLCVNTARRFKRVLADRSFGLLPLQTPGASAEPGARHDELLTEMRVRLPDGRIFGGADAVVEIARRIWRAWPLWAMSRVPFSMDFFRAIYRWIARRRNCGNGVCVGQASRLSPSPGNLFSEVRDRRDACPTERKLWPVSILPLLILPGLALLLAPLMAPWAFMWALAFALYAGCKWLAYCEARNRGIKANAFRTAGCLLAWPGMDATAFLRASNHIAKPHKAEWAFAALKTLLGVALTWAIARAALPENPILAGWLGMIGLIFVLHFGTFHLLSLAWRSIGINAKPLMQHPIVYAWAAWKGAP